MQRSGLNAFGAPTSATAATYQYVPGQDVVASVTDGEGHVTRYGYDDFGRVETVSSDTLGEAGARRYTYDARGNVVGRSDGSVAVTSSYDGLDRLLSVVTDGTSSAAVSYQYRYDEPPFASRLTTIVEPERTVTFTYDWAGRIVSETSSETGVPVSLQTSLAYDLDGALQQITYPSGLTVRIDRDPATRQVTAVRNASDGKPYASAIRHYPGGPLASLVFGNGRTLAQGFNARYEPLTIESGPVQLTYGPSPSGDVGVIWDRSEDPAGCRRDVVRGVSYDFADRVSAWTDSVQSGSGVCPADTIGDLQATYSYVSGTDRIATQRSAGGGHPVLAFGYDLAGNVSGLGQFDPTGTVVSAAACLRHDALGRLVLVGTADPAGVSPGGGACLSDADVTSVKARFKYDARNRRVARQVGDDWTYVVPDRAGNPLSELALSGGAWTKVRDYIWLEGRLLAQVEYGQNGTPAVYYAHLDHLGMPRALTSAAGQLVWSAYQRPNGEVLEKTAPDPATGRTVVTNLRLPGQYDERLFAAAGISGMQGPYYNWARWYVPGLGRYLEPDPVAARGKFNSPYGPNWYGYADANPLRWVDPNGLWAAGVGLGGGAILGTGGGELYVYGVWDGQGQCGILVAPAIRAGLGLGGDLSVVGFMNWDVDKIDELEGFGMGASLALGLVTVGAQASINTSSNMVCEGSKNNEKTALWGAGGGGGLGVTVGAYLTMGGAGLWKVPCPSKWF